MPFGGFLPYGNQNAVNRRLNRANAPQPAVTQPTFQQAPRVTPVAASAAPTAPARPTTPAVNRPAPAQPADDNFRQNILNALLQRSAQPPVGGEGPFTPEDFRRRRPTLPQGLKERQSALIGGLNQFRQTRPAPVYPEPSTGLPQLQTLPSRPLDQRPKLQTLPARPEDYSRPPTFAVNRYTPEVGAQIAEQRGIPMDRLGGERNRIGNLGRRLLQLLQRRRQGATQRRLL